MYVSISLNKSIGLEPHEINNALNETLLRKLKFTVEGKCIKEGYVMPGSVVITSRSAGKSMLSQFNGNFIYYIKYTAQICNPLEGDIIEAEVTNINKMGIIATGGDSDVSPLNILLAKQHHIDNDSFDKIKIGFTVNVKVIGKRFDRGEGQISIIGLLEK
jgi:DNA-directed RNA polymerase subunit E'/Rpb7